MFYSHQLLARKAPLGQIWMAATMHARINRRKLSKLNIIKICEEILNPSVPMALRLSGILMGGVVIVYERKVKLLYDDVSRLLVEINEAWKVKSVSDPTVLPRGKTQARYEAVTLPDNDDLEIERSMSFATEGFPQKGFRMQLDDLEEHYINVDPGDGGSSEQLHQADAANITLLDDLDSLYEQGDVHRRFERFDIEGDDDTQISITPMDERTADPTTLRSYSPPGSLRGRSREDPNKRRPAKRKERSQFPRLAMDNGLLIIQADTYQTWLHDTSDILSKRPRQTKQNNPIASMKISNLMDLPPVALMSGLDKTTRQIHYPEPLLSLWKRCSEDEKNSLVADLQERVYNPFFRGSEGGPPHRPGDTPSHSRTGGLGFEDLGNETGSRTFDASIEKLRANLGNMDFQGVGETLATDVFATPGSPGSGSRHSFLPLEPEIRLASGRSKRHHSSSNNSLRSLDPVEEDAPFGADMGDIKLRKVSEKGLTPDFGTPELLEETAPAQTPQPAISEPTVDKVTESIRTSQFESLNMLALGMNRKKASQLFYQTCVLATCDFVKVEQEVPYGDIAISRGAKM
ncbi:unnamed protein product [Spirodela intermedia]|uniref:Uncharacterized protein n=1 Tax=Spirodela intermedia TaxID=51605 RepID=A0A7I8JQD1_SPIIN|nr:unnamed protein product [Spirodela intermedia]CAA6672340.1 unnamed protein product [Spirodela intermedia]